jgi:hypothetical protein
VIDRWNRRMAIRAILGGLVGLIAGAVTSRDSVHREDSGWLSTQGARLIDGRGRPVRLLGLNWAGAETEAMVPGGTYPPGGGIVEGAVEPYGWHGADWREPIASPLRDLFRSLVQDGPR